MNTYLDIALNVELENLCREVQHCKSLSVIAYLEGRAKGVLFAANVQNEMPEEAYAFWMETVSGWFDWWIQGNSRAAA